MEWDVEEAPPKSVTPVPMNKDKLRESMKLQRQRSQQVLNNIQRSRVQDVDDDELRLEIEYSPDWAFKSKFVLMRFMRDNRITQATHQFEVRDRFGNLFSKQLFEEGAIEDIFPIAFLFTEKPELLKPKSVVWKKERLKSPRVKIVRTFSTLSPPKKRGHRSRSSSPTKSQSRNCSPLRRISTACAAAPSTPEDVNEIAPRDYSREIMSEIMSAVSPDKKVVSPDKRVRMADDVSPTKRQSCGGA